MSGLTVIRVRHRCCLKCAYLTRFGHTRLFLPCLSLSPVFSSLLSCLLNFSRVAFVFSLLILIKAWQNKRAGGLENGLYDSVYGQHLCPALKRLYLRVSTKVPVGLKLPNRVRWPGGGIPYSFQNIPLCPGVVWQNTREPESPDYPIP